MPMSRKFAPLVNAAVGALALMVPVPTTDMAIAELSPLPPVVMMASPDVNDQDDSVVLVARAQASAALLQLQAAARP